jgi:hypothetical protein
MIKMNTLTSKPNLIPRSNIFLTSNIFSFDLERTDHWIPFLTPELVLRPNQIKCQYANPTFLVQHPFEFDATHENHSLVRDLCELIQLYRKNVLFIPKTVFHSKAV